MKETIITLDHGSGGKLSNELIHSIFIKYFGNPILNKMHDGAILPKTNKRIAFSTDSFTVSPIFFPGGNIGDLAIHGTVNDLAMCGAKPKYLSVSFILEEGITIDSLEKIVCSMAKALKNIGIKIVTGDTKVVKHGDVDGIFINTTGLGYIEDGVTIGAEQAKEDDLILINGPIGNHGISVLASRENLDLDKKIYSDTAPLAGMVEKMIEVSKNIHVLRDPTRGGLATALNEIALSSKVGIEIDENRLPIDDNVKDTCEILGYDPLYLANEGKLIAFVPPKDVEKVLDKMKKCKYGEQSKIIGKVVTTGKGTVYLNTSIGGKRIVGMLSGQQLPRIC